jgi:hypothetical protein
MNRSGSIQNSDIGLTVRWEITLEGITAQLGELPGDGTRVMAASNLRARGLLSATLTKPSDVRVAGAVINILMYDRKEILYSGSHAATGILFKLIKSGPLWDPSEEAEKAGCFPYSTVLVNVPIDGKEYRLHPFDDSPRIELAKSYKDRQLIWINGGTKYLIILVVLIKQGVKEAEPVIVFRANWFIDWRLRPAHRGWNSQGEPMGFEVAEEVADNAIDELHALKTANKVAATEIETTYSVGS